MNVNDQWMLNQMQQMAANMATTLPQTGQNSEPPKTEKGESFQDLMNKAKDQKVDAPKQDGASDKKAENVQNETPVQKAEQPQRSQPPLYTKMDKMDAETAALVAAGYAEVVEVYEDGSLLVKLDGEIFSSGFAIAYGVDDSSEGAEELIPIIITSAAGQEVMVTPKQIQDVLDSLGMKPPQDIGSETTVVGQIDLPKYQDMTVLTPDGKVTTLREAMAEAKVQVETGEERQDDADDNLSAELMANSKPLFRDVEAAPVKVGENFVLDTEQPDMEQQLSDAIRFAAQQDLKQIEIKLSPENLGNLTIKLTQTNDGTLQVVLHATNAKAANLLSQHLGNLNAALQGYSQNEVRVEVQRNEDSQQTEQQQQQTDPDGHNRQHQQQQQPRQEDGRSGDFMQKLRLGLFGAED